MSITVPLESIQLNPGSSVTIRNATWQQYLDLTNYLDQESINYRASYFNHIIELMSPDFKNENPKERLSGLVVYFCIEKEIDFYSCGSTDIKRPELAGKQPDSSFCFGTRKEKLDLAIEVIHTSGKVKKLHQIYLLLGVPELWIWKDDQVSFYQLKCEVYELIDESLNLPGLTVDLINQCLAISNEREAAIEFRKAIKQL